MQRPRCRESATHIEILPRLAVVPESAPEHELRRGQQLEALRALIVASHTNGEKRHDA